MIWQKLKPIENRHGRWNGWKSWTWIVYL